MGALRALPPPSDQPVSAVPWPGRPEDASRALTLIAHALVHPACLSPALLPDCQRAAALLLERSRPGRTYHSARVSDEHLVPDRRYIVIPDVLSAGQVEELNAVYDEHMDGGKFGQLHDDFDTVDRHGNAYKGRRE